jgi:GMP synthase (glutamine-hydrolysing)
VFPPWDASCLKLAGLRRPRVASSDLVGLHVDELVDVIGVLEPAWDIPAMRVLAIGHQRDAGPGVFAEAAAAAGDELEHWWIAEAAAPPRELADYDAVMTFGGAMNVDEEDRHPWLASEKALLAELLEHETPLLGVCLGAQLVSAAAGGEPRRASEPEIGWFRIDVTREGAADPLTAGLEPGFEAFEWHSYECNPPPGTTLLASTPLCGQAFRFGPAAWGIQFHAEVTPEIAAGWIDDYRSDPDAVRIGLDPEALRAATRARIEAQTKLGAELCGRFLAAARS